MGTSGWSYDDWVGPFYPKGLARGRWIHHYAERFPTVEVNATHYRFPDAGYVEGMASRMEEAGMVEAVFKMPREITHEAAPAGDLDAVEAHGARFFEALEPAREAGVLAGCLVQFAHDTEPGQVLPCMTALHEAGPNTRLFVEVRHAGFNEERHYRDLLDAVLPTGGAIVATDSPASTITRAPPGPSAYFRFHGRNEETWFLEEPGGVHGSDRYDYEYAPREVEQLAQRVQAAESDLVLAFFNNHVGGQAPRNAEALMDVLGLEPPQKRVSLDDFA